MKLKLVSLFTMIAAFGACSCGGENADKAAEEAKAVSARAAAQKALTDTASDEEPPPPPPEGRIVQAWRDGKMQEMHESEAKAAGLSIIDLSDYWVPFIFSERDTPEQPKLPNHFRPIFRKLANNWPYESRTMAAARAVVEHRKQRVLNARIAELRATGMAEDEIRKTLGLDTDSDSDSSAKPEDKSTDSSAASAASDAGKEDDETASLDVGAGDSDHYLEVYGIPPSLSVLRKRALEEVGRPCFAEIDYNRIRGFDGFVAYSSNEAAKADAQKTRSFAMKMRKEIERLQLKDAMELREHPDNKMSPGLIDMAARYEALIESQKQLVCEGLYDPRDATRYRNGGLDWRTHRALVAFEKKNRIFGWGYLGKETLEALKKTAAERLFDAFMRVVAERVIDGTEIIEDGSARMSDGSIPKYKDEKGVEHEVPNLVAEYSSALIRHMDLTTPDKVIAFLKKQDDKSLGTLFVAIPMPPRPPYYSGEMALHAVINRGDVWYDYPYTEDGREKGQSRKNLPTNTLYVKWNGQDIPLLTTNTTIGAWRTELAPDGYEYFKYKNSDVGPRVWKDIFAGPVWLPPDTSPTTDMIKSVERNLQANT